MNSPLTAGPNLPVQEWNRLRLRAIFDHCKWDPQCEDHAVLAKFPIYLNSSAFAELSQLAEALTHEALSAEEEILGKPRLLRTLAIPRRIRKHLEKETGKPAAHYVRAMRFDFHFTREGWRISEVNADVPGGYVEASGWNELVAGCYEGTRAPMSPTQAYADAICQRVPPGGLVALALTTVYSEDRQVMVHIGRELSRRGINWRLVSPRHIHWQNGSARLQSDFASGELDLLVRFSPAEWLPELCSKEQWEPWFHDSATPLSNPGRALILQSKRFALAWDELESPLSTWRRCLPKTKCPSGIRAPADDEYVLKPAFGRVGEDVGIRGVTGNKEFSEILRAARSREKQWVAQKRFEIVPLETEDGDVFPCIGVYTIDGKTAGFYGRASHSPLIDSNAFDVAVLLRGQNETRGGTA